MKYCDSDKRNGPPRFWRVDVFSAHQNTKKWLSKCLWVYICMDVRLASAWKVRGLYLQSVCDSLSITGRCLVNMEHGRSKNVDHSGGSEKLKWRLKLLWINFSNLWRPSPKYKQNCTDGIFRKINGTRTRGSKSKTSVSQKPALPVAWISFLFCIQQPKMVYRAKVDFVSKTT
jgi:hypothetical protein